MAITCEIHKAMADSATTAGNATGAQRAQRAPHPKAKVARAKVEKDITKAARVVRGREPVLLLPH